MSLPIVVRQLAQAEFDTSVAWYDTQQAGLGDDFAEAVQQTLDTIAANPKRYPEVYGEAREAAVAGFPFCVYYRVRPNRVVVLSVFHTSRDPSVWQGRV